MYLAHISEDKTREQSLLDHLNETAELAGDFAEAFDCMEWGYGCGKIHDIGKYSEEFQKRLKGEHPIVDHATAAAVELYQRKQIYPAYCAAGHHSGLPDGGSASDMPGAKTLKGRLKKNLCNYQAFHTEIEMPSFPKPPIKLLENGGFSLPFFQRMIYSCLVDADFLNTEGFMKNHEIKRGGYDSMETLSSRLQTHIEGWLSSKEKDTINARRTKILKECLLKGKMPQGLYSLTVPTGGGKTISSLAFALQHASEHELERIIYVIPYTSIIEQNAKVFEKILGTENVLEHHCNANYEKGTEGDDTGDCKYLAAENWDIPVIVTTNVQFFESLYANKPSKCRKLHNMSKSVIVFDEAQMLPTDYLKPCVRAIGELILNYHSTAVICTATQPSIQKLFPAEITCHEICEDVKEQYEFFRRTTVEHTGEITADELVERLKKEQQVLCILNNRKRVQQIYNQLDIEGVYHLSTLMYPEHRRRILEEVKERLKLKKRCILVSTSLVEAGVDLDFQTVYRELAGIDSIIQAAGRCNREGNGLREKCKTYVFTLPVEKEMSLPNTMKQPVAISEQIIRKTEDIASLEAIEEYFNLLHYIKGDALDKKEILKAFLSARSESIPFATVAGNFRLIEQNTKTVLITTEPEAEKIAGKLRAGAHSRELLRQCGHYSVNIYKDDFDNMNAAGMLEILDEEIAVLRNKESYSKATGLSLDVHRGDGAFL